MVMSKHGRRAGVAGLLWVCSVVGGGAGGGAGGGLGGSAWAASPAPCQSRDFGFGAAEAGWRHQPLSSLKRDTTYTVEREGNRSVLQARADKSASVFVSRLAAPMGVSGKLGWSWKTDALVPGADNRDKKREDAPVRLIVGFGGDPATLPDAARKQLKRAETLSGTKPPFATLMYLWSEQVAVDTIIPSAHTSQVKMLVASSGAAGLGQWQTLQRDLAADYRSAWGSEPGPLLGLAVMTDTDNTGTQAAGWYADIRLQCGP
jgi:hypothetical protein